jgi:hypothetical protein
VAKRSRVHDPKVSQELNDLWERVKNAETYHKQQFANKAEEGPSLLRGATSYMPDQFDKNMDIINPNLIFSTIRTYVPALYPDNPDIFVRPRGSEWALDDKRDHVYSAFIAGNVLKYYQHQLKMKKTDEMGILGSLCHGIAYSYDGWVTELSNLNPAILKDQPMHRFVSGIDLIPDPNGLEFEDKSFVVRVFGQRYDQMKKMGYDNIEVGDDSDEQYTGYDPKTKQPILPKFYEIWDKNTEKVYTVSCRGDLVRPHKELDFEIKYGFPFSPLAFNPMIDNFYPMSLVDAIKQMQKYITLMVSYGAKHAKMSVPKLIGWEDLMSPKTKRALESGKILDLILLSPKGDGQRIQADQAISSLRQAGLPSDFYNMLNIVRDFMNTISGISEAARGGSQRENTATGTAVVDSYLRSRIGDYKSIVDDWVAASRSKMLKFIRKNAPKDGYLRFHEAEIKDQYFASHPEFKQRSIQRGQYFFVPWTKEDIDGEYDIEVGLGNGVPLNQEARYKKALQDYNIMVNDPLLNKAKVRIHFLREIGVPDAESWIVPPPQPVPEKPKIGINVSFKAESLPPEEQSQILLESGLIPQPPAMPGPGGPGGPGAGGQPAGLQAPGGIHPADAGLGRELGLAGGITTPPRMPEFSGK